MTRYFLDTEFDEDGRTIELISIGVVCEDGRTFYAVSTEFDPRHCNDWVRSNVLPQLPPRGGSLWVPRQLIATELAKFIRPDPEVEIWTYYGDYDWVVTCQLFGPMIKLPEHFPQLALDLKQWALQQGVRQSAKEVVPQVNGEHNALEDARWNWRLYDYLSERERLQAKAR